jgi:hypothetical protein
MKDEGRISHVYRLLYLTIYASFVNVKELTNKSSFISFHTLIKGNGRYVHNE